MGTWGAGNFDSDGALDYISGVVDDLEGKIEDILTDEDRSALDEEGEGVLVPSVAILSALHETVQAPTPEPAVVARWRAQYLAIYDGQIDDLDPDDGYKDERRQVIQSTFDKLETQAQAFWSIAVE
ncbi:hypothetical protein CCAX7_002740 [Capsulimonas corticalis]|uniref:Uncharacterized protein n=1 Tax=Capsulimonas corticalis TaxID=2219043 RepID=A0A402CS21_9BACT|nr:DUF4259 domain-containing protein [Capsulimonas corticalis]BDI28223.1 hypothetical protein CCAX7_002740 [Capsulimonas corticalis]